MGPTIRQPVPIPRTVRVDRFAGGGPVKRRRSPSGLNEGHAWGAIGILLMAVACHRGPAPIEHAAMLSSRGQPREAIELLERFTSENPGAVAERRMLVRLYGVVGRLDLAEKEARALETVLPAGSPVPFVEMGHVFELAHRYEEALAAYDQAANVAPGDPLGPATGGLRAAHWGEAELARPRLEEALRRDSARADIWHALGLVRLNLEDTAGAEQAYRNGLQADPASMENRIGLATVALRRRDPSAALAQYDAVIRVRPRFADARLGRAWALILLGRYDAALSSLDEAGRLGGDVGVIAAQRRLIARLQMKRESQQNQ